MALSGSGLAAWKQIKREFSSWLWTCSKFPLNQLHCSHFSHQVPLGFSLVFPHGSICQTTARLCGHKSKPDHGQRRCPASSTCCPATGNFHCGCGTHGADPQPDPQCPMLAGWLWPLHHVGDVERAPRRTRNCPHVMGSTWGWRKLCSSVLALEVFSAVPWQTWDCLVRLCAVRKVF